MLTALHIQDIVLIDKVQLDLNEGMTALTGETGAGKSILLEALGLATGARPSRASVRKGAKQGSVTAVYEPMADHPVWAVLAENGLSSEDDQIILKRIQSKDGKTRGFINGEPVSVGLLRSIGQTVLEIHGQNEGQGFLSPAAHRGLLDDFAGLGKELGRLKDACEAWKSSAQELEERRSTRAAALRELDYLRHTAEELGTLDPQPGEETQLAEQRAMLMASEAVAEELRQIIGVLDDDGAEDKLAATARRLGRVTSQYHGTQREAGSAQGTASDAPEGRPLLFELTDALERTLSNLMELRALATAANDQLSAAENALEATEERLFALRAAGRKHGCTPDKLVEIKERAETALQTATMQEEEFSTLEKKVSDLKEHALKAAKTVSASRHKTALQLDAQVAAELEPLKLGKAVFKTKIVSDETALSVSGIDLVEFMVATNPGAALGPLKTIASGGELSRFVLAMKAALAAKENRTVIIFDEVDAGVGGAVADAVGERLARLARDAQVLVVTHSPQVAARANTHWLVEKTSTDDTVSTKVHSLNADERVEEIARMLSGAKVTKEARAAALQLLHTPASAKQKAEAKPAKRPRKAKSA